MTLPSRTRLNLKGLALFSYSLATCLGTGMTAAKSLALCAGQAGPAWLRHLALSAARECEQGQPVSEALSPGRRRLPGFYLPLVHAGEVTGRLTEAFELLHDYCRRLEPTLKLVRNSWLIPLVCILFGYVVRAGLIFYFASPGSAMRFVAEGVLEFGGLALVAYGVWHVPVLKRGFDWVLLQLPFAREMQLRLGLALFFETLNLAYKAGGLSALSMFDLALATVSNTALRADLLRARAALAEGETFGDAFAQTRLLDDDQKSMIATGAFSGALDSCLERMVAVARDELETALTIFNNLFHRIVAFTVAMSIVGTLLMLLSSAR